jgi:transposase
MNKTARIGLDLAKYVFQVHAVDAQGKVALTKTLKRNRLLEFFVELEPCLVGMEACSCAHHWARELARLGHEVRLMAAQFVIPYRKSGKNDRNDA